MKADDADIPGHISKNRKSAESKLRRSKKNCPVCMVPFEKNAKRTKRVRVCLACQAHPSVGKRCIRCAADTIWENKEAAACQSCGAHGQKLAVIADHT